MTAKVRRLDKDKPVELRAQLRHSGQPVSETWSHILPPQ
jgi:glucans biosynthesis protein